MFYQCKLKYLGHAAGKGECFYSTQSPKTGYLSFVEKGDMKKQYYVCGLRYLNALNAGFSENHAVSAPLII